MLRQVHRVSRVIPPTPRMLEKHYRAMEAFIEGIIWGAVKFTCALLGHDKRMITADYGGTICARCGKEF